MVLTLFKNPFRVYQSDRKLAIFKLHFRLFRVQINQIALLKLLVKYLIKMFKYPDKVISLCLFKVISHVLRNLTCFF